MKIKISFETFLKTGKFGSIELGMTKDKVIAILGDTYSYGDFGDSEIIHYHWFEFFFWKETQRLYHIQNDSISFRGLKQKYKEFDLDLWFLKPNKLITYKEAKAFFNKNNLPFKEEVNRAGVHYLTFESGVKLIFTNETYKRKKNETTKKWEYEDVFIENYENFVIIGICYANIEFIY